MKVILTQDVRGQGKRGQRRDFGDFVHDVFSSFYTFFQ